MQRIKEMDLTNGPILKKLLIYSIPLILTNILQILFHTADIAVLGIMVSDDAVGAVSANGALNGLIVGLFVAFSIGTNVVLARKVGQKDLESARKTVGTSILIALISGFILLSIGVPLAEVFLKIMNCDPEILGMATTYLRIYFLGMPIMMLYNFCSSILRATGDTRRPLIFLAIGGVANVILNISFVLMGMTVEGVAIGTILSQLISATLSLITLFKSKGYGNLQLKYLKIYKKELKEILHIAIPSALQNVAFNISNVLIQSTVNSFEKVGTSANGTAVQFDNVIYMIGNAIAVATTTFVGQNVGAKKPERIKKAILCAVLLCCTIELTIGLTFAIFAKNLCGIIAESQEVIKLASIRLTIMGSFYFLCSIMETLANAVRAMGKPVFSLIVSVLGASVFRIIFLKVTFYFVPEFYVIYLSYPVSWTFTILIYLFVTSMVYKRLKTRLQKEVS
ncbi:MAG: MATE family efflux transporter [Clostridiales bacterium]|nr:MATE family efflux transporter [Clostridiales bacterium]